MLRHPVVITSIEEDFKNIGLLRESAEPAEVATYEDPTMEDDDDDIEEDDDDIEEFTLSQEEMDELESMGVSSDDDDDDDEYDESATEAFSVQLDDAFFEDVELDADDLAEKYGEGAEDRLKEMVSMMQALEGRRRSAGKRGMVRTKRMSSRARMKARKYYKSHKRKIGKQRLKRAKSSHGRRLMRLAKSFKRNENQLSTALEHVNELIQDLDEDLTLSEAQPAFASIALVAEMLVHVLESSLDEDEELSEEASDLIETFTNVAHWSADAVEFLQDTDEDELDATKVFEAYKDYLETVQEALSLISETDDDEGND